MFMDEKVTKINEMNPPSHVLVWIVSHSPCVNLSCFANNQSNAIVVPNCLVLH